MPCQPAFASFRGNDCRHTSFLQPIEKTAQFGAKNTCVRESSVEGFECVQHHAFRADRVNGESQSDEQPVEIVFPSFLDFAADDSNVFHQQSLLGGERMEVKTH